MAVYYKLYKNNRKEGKAAGKWYSRATMLEVVNLDKLADQMQANCTVKKSDIKAVLTELVDVMKLALQNSKRVKLDGFGSFKVGISSLGADSAKEFTVGKHVKGLHIVFQPEVHISADGQRTKTFLTGTTVKEAGNYNVVKEDSTSTTQNG